MPPIELSQEQVNNLARPIVGMVETIADFFKNPQNEKAYRDGTSESTVNALRMR